MSAAVRLADRYPGAAVVTGASSGIGQAFARRLAREGFDIVAIARRADRLDELQTELEREHRVRVHTIVCDLTDRAAVDALPVRVRDRGVNVGVLVHGAGALTFGAFETIDPARHADLIDLHCRVPVMLTSAWLPEMKRRKRGAVIFVGSVSSYQSIPFLTVYGASKAFVLMFGEALWGELRRSGVDTLVVCPGWVRSELMEQAGVHVDAHTGWWTADAIVNRALTRLGRGPSMLIGANERVMIALTRLSPRALAVLGSLLMIRRQMKSAAVSSKPE